MYKILSKLKVIFECENSVSEGLNCYLDTHSVKKFRLSVWMSSLDNLTCSLDWHQSSVYIVFGCFNILSSCLSSQSICPVSFCWCLDDLHCCVDHLFLCPNCVFNYFSTMSSCPQRLCGCLDDLPCCVNLFCLSIQTICLDILKPFQGVCDRLSEWPPRLYI